MASDLSKAIAISITLTIPPADGNLKGAVAKSKAKAKDGKGYPTDADGTPYVRARVQASPS